MACGTRALLSPVFRRQQGFREESPEFGQGAPRSLCPAAKKVPLNQAPHHIQLKGKCGGGQQQRDTRAAANEREWG